MEIEVLDELIEDINPWSNFYIVSDDDSKQLAIFLGDELENQDISYSIILKGMEDSFKEDLHEDDLVLAISRSGREDHVLSMVKTALKSRVKVYAICSDFRSPLAMFADETIIINEADDFELKVLEIIHEISMNLFKDASDSEYEILKGAEHAPMPDPEGNVKSTMYGMIVKINVNVGDEVNEGDVIYIIEAMKMENEVSSEETGVVKEIFVKEGDNVIVGDSIMEIE